MAYFVINDLIGKNWFENLKVNKKSVKTVKVCGIGRCSK